MNVEDIFTLNTDPINQCVKGLSKRAEIELAYFVLTRNDFELENYDIRTILSHEEYRTALWLGFDFETTKRVTPRSIVEVSNIREMAVQVLRRNEINVTTL